MPDAKHNGTVSSAAAPGATAPGTAMSGPVAPSAMKHGAVKLRELTSSRELRGLEQLHLASTTSPVRDVALVADIEEVSSVGPDTIVVLTQDVARGGWMISAALRYAWERRACALVVPKRSFTSTVIELARRLGLSLFTTDVDMTRVSLDIAMQLGVIRAGSLARLQTFHDRIAGVTELSEALGLISEELDGAPVSIESGEGGWSRNPGGRNTRSGSTGSRSTEARSTDDGRRVAVAIPGDSTADDALVAIVPEHGSATAEQVLSMAAPTVRALLLASRLDSMQASLPLVSLAVVSGVSARHSLDPPQLQGAFETLESPLDEHWIAVCITCESRDRAGHAVHRFWNELFPRTPLAGVSEGWVGFIAEPESGSPSESGSDTASSSGAVAYDRLRGAIAGHPELGRSFGIAVGVSKPHRGSAEAAAGLREAWYAARIADPAHAETAVVSFDATPLRLLARALPSVDAAQMAESLLPQLMQDSARTDLIEALLAYLGHHGSATAAAATLGVHRNTLQSRLRRVQELGVPLDDPTATLPLHMLLSSAMLSER
ncbi:PucR family transcriptional regulator [Leucobacter sp. GX24907]